MRKIKNILTLALFFVSFQLALGQQSPSEIYFKMGGLVNSPTWGVGPTEVSVTGFGANDGLFELKIGSAMDDCNKIYTTFWLEYDEITNGDVKVNTKLHIDEGIVTYFDEANNPMGSRVFNQSGFENMPTDADTWRETFPTAGIYRAVVNLHFKTGKKKKRTHASFSSYFGVETVQHNDEIEVLEVGNRQIDIKYISPVSHSCTEYSIDYGDGTPIVQTVQNATCITQNNIIASHTYANPGIYTVTFKRRITDHFYNGTPSAPVCYHTTTSKLVFVNPCDFISEMLAKESFSNDIPKCYVTVSKFDEAAANIDGLVLTGISLDFGDGTVLNNVQEGINYQHQYAESGTYTITQTFNFNMGFTCTQEVLYNATDPEVCCTNFAPEPGKTYWISAWVQEDHPIAQLTYTKAALELEYIGTVGLKQTFYPSGDIIDGWQRIVGQFSIPVNTTDLKINLVNGSGTLDVYFDDVRVHPFEASMKSYVYDPQTLRLMAELDDNNYATFYEYDNEGQLIRIKKETERGVMTIQESRSNNPKKNN